MSYYFVANIRIENQNEYQKYIDEVGVIFRNYRGKYLSVDDKPRILEGNWNYTRSVLVEFESVHDFEEWYFSEEYQRILKYRLNGAHCDTILIKSNDKK